MKHVLGCTFKAGNWQI